jgi:hypothetical protein
LWFNITPPAFTCVFTCMIYSPSCLICELLLLHALESGRSLLAQRPWEVVPCPIGPWPVSV